jgi:hypothetical protein
VPATVQTILAARIDRLPAEEKQLLQAASVIGKTCPTCSWRRSPSSRGGPPAGLAHLQEAEFLYETQLFPDLEFTFKHALTPRRGLRGAPGGAPARIFTPRWWPPSSACTPIVSSSTWSGSRTTRGRAKVWEKAVRYLRQAGAKVFLRSANREAAACFEQALDTLRRLPEHPDAITESLDIRFDPPQCTRRTRRGGPGWGSSSRRPNPWPRPSEIRVASAAR